MKQNENQQISPIKGRPMLYWMGKKPLQAIEFYPAQEKEIYGDTKNDEFNKLFWGDNLQVLAHLLKENRGKVDLVYIDPPFDSRADYVKQIEFRGQQIMGQSPGIIEEVQYSDIWENDEYYQFLYERLQLIRELMSDKASIYVHLDYRRQAYIKIIMDEVFGEENFINEICWKRTSAHSDTNKFGANHDTILFYSKNPERIWNNQYIKYDEEYLTRFRFTDKDGRKWTDSPLTAKGLSGGGYEYEYKGIKGYWRCPLKTMEALDKQDKLHFTKNGGIRVKKYLDEMKGLPIQTVWTDIYPVNSQAVERNDYPTQKPIELLNRIILASSNPGDLVLDCFCGGGTTLIAAQNLGRKWLGCDINLGAIQTTTKALNQIIQKQKDQQTKLIDEKFSGLFGFKVLNVNDYDVFKNEFEAKEIILSLYGIEGIKRNYFDGMIDNKLVKVMPLNRVLNKQDMVEVFKNIESQLADFTPKKTSKTDESTYEEGVLIIASGLEASVYDFLKTENHTGVQIEIRDIQKDKKSLVFKRPCEAKIKVELDGSNATIEILEFYSPLLIQKLELENEKRLKRSEKVMVENSKQIIESVCIDMNYDGKLFNAEIMDLPNNKKEMVKGKYTFDYKEKGKQTIAVKIIDVLGEEYFETFRVEIK